MRPRNIFVVGPTRLHWKELETVRGAGRELIFHRLLRTEQVLHVERMDVERLLDDARRVLDDFPGTVDAIIAHWDFPTTLIVPILCAERGLRAPSVDSVVHCGHKYWSRMAQRETVPEMTPPFALVDPFDEPREPPLPYPFWLKPVKGYSSHLGFRIDDRAELERALATTRAEIGRIADPYDRLLEQAGVDVELRAVSARYCLAEAYVSGLELAHEGYVRDGRVTVTGTLDMVREEECFTRFVWPSGAPPSVLARMEEATRRFLTHIGFDDGCFNAEFFWDPDTDRLTAIEVNPRISQSHSPMCVLHDGHTNHEIAVDIALGREPRFTPGAGRWAVAAKFLDRTTKDGFVRRVPKRSDLRNLHRRFPTAQIEVDAKAGQRLSEQLDQDAYSHMICEIYLGADSHEELLEQHARLVEALPIEIDGVSLPDDLVGNRPGGLAGAGST